MSAWPEWWRIVGALGASLALGVLLFGTVPASHKLIKWLARRWR